MFTQREPERAWQICSMGSNKDAEGAVWQTKTKIALHDSDAICSGGIARKGTCKAEEKAKGRTNLCIRAQKARPFTHEEVKFSTLHPG